MSNDERKREDDLVKRLRWKAGAYAKEAANRIEQLAATVEKLEEKNSRLKLDLLLANDVADAAIEGKKELEAKLATCEKYKAAYAECDRIGTQAVRDLEAKLASVIAAYRIEAMRREDYSHEAFDQHIAELKGETS